MHIKAANLTESEVWIIKFIKDNHRNNCKEMKNTSNNYIISYFGDTYQIVPGILGIERLGVDRQS